MIENELNELLSLLARDKPADTNAMRDLSQRLCPSQELAKRPNEPITREMLSALYHQGLAEANLEERLFFLFYHLDQGKYVFQYNLGRATSVRKTSATSSPCSARKYRSTTCRTASATPSYRRAA